MKNYELTVSMDLRTYNAFIDTIEEENLDVFLEEDAEDLNFGVETLTNATIISTTTVIMTSIVNVLIKVVSKNKRMELTIGEDSYKFENYTPKEIKELMELSDKKRVIRVLDKED